MVTSSAEVATRPGPDVPDVWDTPAAPVDGTTSSAVATIADWARELDAAYSIAKMLVLTAFSPDHFKGKPADAAAAILTGHELGLTPMAALRSIYMVHGTPGMYAKVMVAVAQSHGHTIHVVEQSDELVVVEGTRRGSPRVYRTEWTPARVKTAGLDSNKMYRTNPQAMMVARGQAEIARQVAADALHGVPYSVEELEDIPPVKADATVTAATLLADRPAIEQASSPADGGPEMASPEQRRLLQRLLRDTARPGLSRAVPYIAHVIGRKITGPEDLTAGEAAVVIRALRFELDATAPGKPPADTPPDPRAAAAGEQPELEP